MRLKHIHLPGLTSYGRALALQNALIEQHVEFKSFLSTLKIGTSSSEDIKRKKAQLRSAWSHGQLDTVLSEWGILRRPNENTRERLQDGPMPLTLLDDPPAPTVLTLEHEPVYTLGRRAHATVSKEQREFLRANGTAEVVESERGGLETFHGPGQLVAYPVLGLSYQGLGLRAYVHLLEEAVIKVLGRWHLQSIRTADPGVWMPGGEKKIASLGVSVRRGITKFGIGLNVVDTPKDSDTGWLDWGFGRITACGLEGKEVTWIAKERSVLDSHNEMVSLSTETVGNEFVEELQIALASHAPV
ncbi:MAG: hypothetical protein Q9160_007340 [Pyrenula sp. 1 TL-2023]